MTDPTPDDYWQWKCLTCGDNISLRRGARLGQNRYIHDDDDLEDLPSLYGHEPIRAPRPEPVPKDRTEDDILQDFNRLLIELAIVRGQGDEGDFPTDWVLVADINNLNGADKDGYYNMSMRIAPGHITKGLLQHGLDRYTYIEMADYIRRNTDG